MKKKTIYEEAKINLTLFEGSDIISTSGIGKDPGTNDGEWLD